MAITLVKMGTVAASNSPSFGQATGSGNLLIAIFTSVGDPTINVGPGWVKDVSAVSTNSAAAAIFHKPNSSAGETAPTFSSTNPKAAVLAEFSGADTISPLDQTGTNTGVSSPVTATASAADGASGELFIAAFLSDLSKLGTGTTGLTSNNATLTLIDENGASSDLHHRLSYSLSTTSNASADTAVASDTNMNLDGLAVVCASFKIASAVTFQPRPTAINFQDPAYL